MSRYLVPLAMLLAFMVFMPRGSHAQEPQSVYTYSVSGITSGNLSGGPFPSAAAACGAWVQSWNSDPNASGYQERGAATLTASNESSCEIKFVVGNGVPSVTKALSGTACPGGSLQSGATCICPTGSTWTGSTCQTAQQAAQAQCDAAAGTPATIPGDAGSARSVCHNGCTVKVDAVMCSSGSTMCTTMGDYSKVGTPCAASNVQNTTGTSTCAAGQCPANINGQQVCLSCGSPGTAPTARTSSTSTSSDGTSTRADVSRSCNGTVCRTTTTNTKLDASGNPISSTTDEEVTNDPDKRPEAECDDATRSLGLLKCSQLGTPSPGGAVASSTVGPSSITPVSGLAGPGSCPADIPLPLGMSFSFSGVCQGGTALRPLIIALAWLAAGYIVFGGLKRG
jgi:hypothetical protein